MIEIKDNETGEVRRIGNRIGRALVDAGRFTYLTGAIAEDSVAKVVTADKPARPKAEKKPKAEKARKTDPDA